MDFFTREELMELYKLEISRENEIRDKWRRSMEVYLTLLLTIFSGSTILSNFLKEKSLVMFSFIGAGVIVILLAIVAYLHFRLDYKYQMEILSIQAKIEDMLDLTNPEKCNLPPRWSKEALLPPWYYSNKFECSNSKQFISKMCSFKKINFYPIVYFIFLYWGLDLLFLEFYI